MRRPASETTPVLAQQVRSEKIPATDIARAPARGRSAIILVMGTGRVGTAVTSAITPVTAKAHARLTKGPSAVSPATSLPLATPVHHGIRATASSAIAPAMGAAHAGTTVARAVSG